MLLAWSDTAICVYFVETVPNVGIIIISVCAKLILRHFLRHKPIGVYALTIRDYSYVPSVYNYFVTLSHQIQTKPVPPIQ